MKFSRIVPPSLRPSARWLWRLPFYHRVAQDRSSFEVLRQASRPGAKRMLPRRTVRVKALGGHPAHIRSGTADPEVAIATFVGQFHLPPRGLKRPELIWDLGANIGLTMAHFAYLFPHARVVGVELDAENVALARTNVAHWRERCEVIHAAVWPWEGELRFDAEAGREDGARVSSGGARLAPALTLDELLDRTGPPNYVKMDIEGAERLVLAHETRWATSVKCIAVECHPPYSLRQCVEDLRRVGFDTDALPQTWRRRARDCVVGWR